MFFPSNKNNLRKQDELGVPSDHGSVVDMNAAVPATCI